MQRRLDSPVTVAEIARDPSRVATSFRLSSGELVTFRPLVAEDAPILGAYLLRLSEETRRRYAPHPFDQDTADDLCATVDYAHTIRLLAVLDRAERREVIGYFILRLGVGQSEIERYAQAGYPLDPQADCMVAPSVADTYQDRGLGSVMMAALIQVARRLGRRRIVLMGGTQATNHRAIHFYAKCGFCTIGEFEWPAGLGNYDMMLDLW